VTESVRRAGGDVAAARRRLHRPAPGGDVELAGVL